MHRELIKRYLEGGTALSHGIQGLFPNELNAFPVPGTWSIQQIVMHLVDSDLIASDRMKRIIAEDRPRLVAYDETKFATNLFYEKLDPKLAARVFHDNRVLTATILAQLSPEAFDRVGVHSEYGDISLLSLLQKFVDHLDHHMKFLRDKREKLGKPMH